MIQETLDAWCSLIGLKPLISTLLQEKSQYDSCQDQSSRQIEESHLLNMGIIATTTMKVLYQKIYFP